MSVSERNMAGAGGEGSGPPEEPRDLLSPVRACRDYACFFLAYVLACTALYCAILVRIAGSSCWLWLYTCTHFAGSAVAVQTTHYVFQPIK